MSTGTVLDLRRTDLRTGVLANPYWITSADIGVACDDQDAVLFSFPITKSVSPGYGAGMIIIHALFYEVVTAYNGTSDILVGVGSLATDAVTTAGAITDKDVDEYFQTGEITVNTPGWYTPATGDVVALWASQEYTPYASILPADSTVFCIEAQLTGTSPTTGAGRVHVLISEVPFV
jgi:hypothetical protein